MGKMNEIDKAGKLWQHEKLSVSNANSSHQRSMSLSSPIEKQSTTHNDNSSMSPTPYRKRSLSSMESTKSNDKDETRVMTPSSADKVSSSAMNGHQLKVDSKVSTPSAVEKMPSSAIGISEFNLRIGKDSKIQKN